MSDETEKEIIFNISCNNCKSEFQIKTTNVNYGYFEDHHPEIDYFSKNSFRAICVVCGSNDIEW